MGLRPGPQTPRISEDDDTIPGGACFSTHCRLHQNSNRPGFQECLKVYIINSCASDPSVTTGVLMLFQIITPERPNPQWVSGRKECKRWGLPRCIPRRRNPFSVEHSFLPGKQSSTCGTAYNGRHNTTTATQESVAASGYGFGRDFGPGATNAEALALGMAACPISSACYQSILGCGDARSYSRITWS